MPISIRRPDEDYPVELFTELDGGVKALCVRAGDVLTIVPLDAPLGSADSGRTLRGELLNLLMRDCTVTMPAAPAPAPAPAAAEAAIPTIRLVLASEGRAMRFEHDEAGNIIRAVAEEGK